MWAKVWWQMAPRSWRRSLFIAVALNNRIMDKYFTTSSPDDVCEKMFWETLPSNAFDRVRNFFQIKAFDRFVGVLKHGFWLMCVQVRYRPRERSERECLDFCTCPTCITVLRVFRAGTLMS